MKTKETNSRGEMGSACALARPARSPRRAALRRKIRRNWREVFPLGRFSARAPKTAGEGARATHSPTEIHAL